MENVHNESREPNHELQAVADGVQGTREPSKSDDRIWAALAHGSALLFAFGPIVAIVLWFTQRKKSAYITFHVLQAMAYQVLFFWIWLTVVPIVLTVVVLVLIFILAAAAPHSDNAFLAAVLPQILIWGVLLGTFAVYGMLALVGVVATLTGGDFKYPLIGKWLSHYVEYGASVPGSVSEDQEDRVVAAVCHSTCVVPFFGLLTPIVVWLTQHERSALLRFQAMQAAIYQAVGLIGYVVFMALDILFVFAMVGAAVGSDFAGRSSAVPVWLSLIMLPFMCILCVFALAVPLYHLFGFLASVRVLRGHDFRYPVLGRILASKMKPTEAK